MVHKSNVVIKAVLAATAGLMLLLASNDIRLAEPDTWVSKAHAVRGRPATPVSYAGVARRTTRRVVATDAATTNCVQQVNAYGQVVTVCN